VPLNLRRGENVEVLSLAGIRATLDARGRRDGIPFMPEMERFAGARARVWRRADRVCVEGSGTMRRLPDAVFLEDLRCDGAAHGGCQRACLLIWCESWLRRAADGPVLAPAPAALDRPTPPGFEPCQSTALLAASTPLPVWRADQYARDVLTGNLSLRELLYSFSATLGHHVERATSALRRRARPSRTPQESLGLSPGEEVEVKRLEEIEATLDARQKNRGLEFSPGMSRYCGRRFRVDRRLERMIVEKTGEMRAVSDTVLLEGLHCDGACSRGCPRANPLYWREIWLRRV
jgi:hypothetical protein